MERGDDAAFLELHAGALTFDDLAARRHKQAFNVCPRDRTRTGLAKTAASVAVCFLFMQAECDIR